MYDFLEALPVTAVVSILIITAATVALQIWYSTNSLYYGPIILTMLGILGCFVGIALGLFHFDTTNIQNSVPACSTESRHPFGHRLPVSRVRCPSRLAVGYLDLPKLAQWRRSAGRHN